MVIKTYELKSNHIWAEKFFAIPKYVVEWLLVLH